MKKLTTYALPLIVAMLAFNSSFAQQISPPKGYSHDIGNMVAMLDDIKEEFTGSR